MATKSASRTSHIEKAIGEWIKTTNVLKQMSVLIQHEQAVDESAETGVSRTRLRPNGSVDREPEAAPEKEVFLYS